MQAHYRHKKVANAKQGKFTLPEYKNGSSIAIAVEGTHGEECVYCVAKIDGKLCGFPRRAPDYKANQWEHMVCGSDKNNTFYLELPDGMQGKEIELTALFSNRRKAENCVCDVYICEKH